MGEPTRPLAPGLKKGESRSCWGPALVARWLLDALGLSGKNQGPAGNKLSQIADKFDTKGP